MTKKDVFTFTAPNGVEVTGVVIDVVETTYFTNLYLCYAQNRLFYTFETIHDDYVEKRIGETIVDYAVLPAYDTILKAEQQKFEDDCYEALSSIGDTDF